MIALHLCLTSSFSSFFFRELERTVEDLQAALHKRFPDSVATLIHAAKPSESHVVSSLRRDLQRAKEDNEEAQRHFERRVLSLQVEQEKVKAQYEDTLKTLQQQLHLQPPPSTATLPPTRSTSSSSTAEQPAGDLQQRITALETEKQRLRTFYTRKLEEQQRRFDSQLRALKRGDHGHSDAQYHRDHGGASDSSTSSHTNSSANTSASDEAENEGENEAENEEVRRGRERLLQNELMQTVQALGTSRAECARLQLQVQQLQHQLQGVPQLQLQDGTSTANTSNQLAMQKQLDELRQLQQQLQLQQLQLQQQSSSSSAAPPASSSSEHPNLQLQIQSLMQAHAQEIQRLQSAHAETVQQLQQQLQQQVQQQVQLQAQLQVQQLQASAPSNSAHSNNDRSSGGTHRNSSSEAHKETEKELEMLRSALESEKARASVLTTELLRLQRLLQTLQLQSLPPTLLQFQTLERQLLDVTQRLHSREQELQTLVQTQKLRALNEAQQRERDFQLQLQLKDDELVRFRNELETIVHDLQVARAQGSAQGGARGGALQTPPNKQAMHSHGASSSALKTNATATAPHTQSDSPASSVASNRPK